MTMSTVTPLPARRAGKKINNFDDLRAWVDRRGGIHLTTMGRLRDLQQAGKLGIHVVAQIEKSLRLKGLAVMLPAGSTELPRDQNAEVILYSLASKVGEVIAAVHAADKASTTILREVADDDSVEKLDAIRSILDS